MKKILALLLTLTLLSGCGFLGDRSYTVVTPHDEEAGVTVDADSMTVSSFLSLKNAILRLVEETVEEGVIRAESYSGDLSEDLRNAVYEVSRADPLGAFAVDYMTYDYSQIVGYSEIHIHTTYQRSLEEIQSIVNTSGTDGVKRALQEAMENYDPILRLRIGDYSGIHVQTLVREVFYDHPEFALELPETETVTYPESGTRRILEIRFHYRHSRDLLQRYREEMAETVESLAGLYGSSNSQMVCAQRLLNRICRDGIVTEEGEGLNDSVYGALLKGEASAYAYAQSYLQMLKARNISGELIYGTYMDEDRVWCSVAIDGQKYVVDPAAALADRQPQGKILPQEAAEAMGYLLE